MDMAEQHCWLLTQEIFPAGRSATSQPCTLMARGNQGNPRACCTAAFPRAPANKCSKLVLGKAKPPCAQSLPHSSGHRLPAAGQGCPEEPQNQPCFLQRAVPVPYSLRLARDIWGTPRFPPSPIQLAALPKTKPLCKASQTSCGAIFTTSYTDTSLGYVTYLSYFVPSLSFF